MGLDLKMLPYYLGGKTPSCNFSHSVIECSSDRDLIDCLLQIEKRKGIEVDNGFVSYLGRDEEGETLYKETLTTAYGERLMYVTAGDIKPFLEPLKTILPEAAYICLLDDAHKIALYWH